VERVAREEDLAVRIMDGIVASPEEAVRLRFPGSPTVRADGRDLQPEIEALGDYGLG
jgi:hypothetical protein